MLTRAQTKTNTPMNGQQTAALYGFITSRRNWLLVIPVLLLSTLLTVPHLNGAFWVDEVITVQRAGSPINGGPFSPAQIWNHTATTSYDQVPGYYMLVSIWDNQLGFSEFSTRLFSMMVGLLAIALVYRMGRAMHSPLAGLGAATALAVSEHMIKFMHEGRTYALLVLLGALLIWCYWRLLKGHRSWWVQGGLLLAAVGLLYSHYFASLLVFSVCAYHLFFVRKDREWWRVVVIMGIAGALFLPWVIPNFDAVQGANNQGWRQAMAMTAPELTNEVLTFFGNGSLAMLLLIGVFALQLRRPTNRLLWFMLIAPVVLGLIVNLWLGMLVSSKFYLYLWVPLALLFGIGLAGVARRGLHPAYILVPWLLVGHLGRRERAGGPGQIHRLGCAAQATRRADHPRRQHHLPPASHRLGWRARARHRVLLLRFPARSRRWSGPGRTPPTKSTSTVSARPSKARRASGAAMIRSTPRHASAAVFEPIMRDAGFANCGPVAREPLMNVDLYTRPPQDGFNFDFGADQYTEGIQMAPARRHHPALQRQSADPAGLADGR